MINSGEIRAFIAIELPSDLKALLREFENRLKKPGLHFVKWVDPSAIHLTLKFLGNINEKTLADIKSNIAVEVNKHHSFKLNIGDTGFFPNLKHPRVFWVGLTGETDKLISLQADIDAAAARLGFQKEARPFNAHLTLARFRDASNYNEISHFVNIIKDASIGAYDSFSVMSVSLMRSQLRPKGAVYTQLSKFGLSG